MKLRVFLTVLILASAFPARAEKFFSLFGGMGKHGQKEMEDSNTYPTGSLYGAGLGRRENFWEFELTLSQANFSADINHDGKANTLVHKQVQASLALNFYLLKWLYARLGYSMTKISQSAEKPMTEASQEGFEKEYGIKDGQFTGGGLYGVGWVMADWKTVSAYLQYDHVMPAELEGKQDLFTLGLRCYF